MLDKQELVQSSGATITLPFLTNINWN